MTKDEALKQLANTDGLLDELVHDLKSDEASSINNSGPDEQVDYIISALGEKEGLKEIALRLNFSK